MTPAVSAPGVDIETRGHVGIIALNRPAVRNAVDRPTADGLAAALDAFEADREVRAIVITGRGGFFCAGMDLKAFAATGERPITADRGAFGIVAKPPTKPLVAAVEGAALGGGLEIALAADVIVVADDAWLGLPEVARGLVAAAGGLIRLPQRIPRALALEMILTGKPISAQRAYEIGLVNYLAPAASVLDRALDLVQSIAANAPMALRASKAIATESADWRAEDAFMLQRTYTEPIRESVDAKEGARAFVEKRPPVWQDC